MGTVSLDILKEYIQAEGGVVTSQQIVKHFQPFLKDPVNKDRNKEIFKSYLSTLTDYRHEEGSNTRILELKKAYRLEKDLSKENTPRYDRTYKDQLQPMREAQRLVSSRSTDRDVGEPRRVTHRAIAPKQFGVPESSEITLSSNVELDCGEVPRPNSALLTRNPSRDLPRTSSREPILTRDMTRDPPILTRDLSRENLRRDPSREFITRRSGHRSPRTDAHRSPMPGDRYRSHTTTATTGARAMHDSSAESARIRSKTTAGRVDDEESVVNSGAEPAQAAAPVIRRASINAINMFNRTAQQKKPIKVQEPVLSEDEKEITVERTDTLDSADHTEELREEMESGCSNVPLEQNEREWIVKSALGDCDTISRLLLTDRNLVTYRDFISGYTGLHWSCKLARIDMSRVLIEGGSDVNARSHSGQTPLHLAAQTGKGEVIDLLLRSGADKEMRDHKGRKPGQYLPAGAGPETRSLLTLPQPPLNLETNPALRKFSKAMSVGDMADNAPKRGQTMHQAWKKYKQSFVGKKKRGDHSLKVETAKRESVTNRLDHHGNKDKVRTMPSSKQAAVFLSS